MNQPPRRGRRGGVEDRQAAGLTGGGPSQLGVDGSMRARDVSRPTAQDALDAEQIVQVSFRPRSHPREHRTADPVPRPGQDASGSGGSSPLDS